MSDRPRTAADVLAQAVCDARTRPGSTAGKPSFTDRRVVAAVLVALRDVEDLASLVDGKHALHSCAEDPELSDARGCWHAMLDALIARLPELPAR